jgi:hypothetical protein
MNWWRGVYLSKQKDWLQRTHLRDTKRLLLCVSRAALVSKDRLHWGHGCAAFETTAMVGAETALEDAATALVAWASAMVGAK